MGLWENPFVNYFTGIIVILIIFLKQQIWRKFNPQNVKISNARAVQKSYPEKQPNLQPILPTFLLTLLCLLTILFKRDTPKQLKEMLEKRMNLDRCRLEEGFLLLACLQSIKQHNLWQELSMRWTQQSNDSSPSHWVESWELSPSHWVELRWTQQSISFQQSISLFQLLLLLLKEFFFLFYYNSMLSSDNPPSFPLRGVYFNINIKQQ